MVETYKILFHLAGAICGLCFIYIDFYEGSNDVSHRIIRFVLNVFGFILTAVFMLLLSIDCGLLKLVIAPI